MFRRLASAALRLRHLLRSPLRLGIRRLLRHHLLHRGPRHRRPEFRRRLLRLLQPPRLLFALPPDPLRLLRLERGDLRIDIVVVVVVVLRSGEHTFGEEVVVAGGRHGGSLGLLWAVATFPNGLYTVSVTPTGGLPNSTRGAHLGLRRFSAALMGSSHKEEILS